MDHSATVCRGKTLAAVLPPRDQNTAVTDFATMRVGAGWPACHGRYLEILRPFTLRWPCEARPSKGDGPGRSSFEARFASTRAKTRMRLARDDGQRLRVCVGI